MEEIIKVNRQRLPIIIGHNGETKKLIEKKTQVSLEIDSHTGEIIIVGQNNYYDVYNAKKVITAISRGFSPENAFTILKGDNTIEIMSIETYIGKNNNRIHQIKGRIIGREGTIKNLIEKKYGCLLAVYGKTVGIIARSDQMAEIMEIVESLINGCKHTTVFKLIKRSKVTRSIGNVTVKDDVSEKIDDIDFS